MYMYTHAGAVLSVPLTCTIRLFLEEVCSNV